MTYRFSYMNLTKCNISQGFTIIDTSETLSTHHILKLQLGVYDQLT